MIEALICWWKGHDWPALRGEGKRGVRRSRDGAMANNIHRQIFAERSQHPSTRTAPSKCVESSDEVFTVPVPRTKS